jgi:hypothetical protein
MGKSLLSQPKQRFASIPLIDLDQDSETSAGVMPMERAIFRTVPCGLSQVGFV